MYFMFLYVLLYSRCITYRNFHLKETFKLSSSMFVFYEGILSLYLIEEVEKEKNLQEVDFTHSTPNWMELD